ncbi:hypothetical protein CMV_003272 [Castanea mollissima]|uniref:Uncharacterized protein n=1 Tax=Castanea mollissima TaxID=60419 RepID=A0A8J4W5I8_9ROSI|nr:hypothetical protein CMV_003272 [Castanea mollissima]
MQSLLFSYGYADFLPKSPSIRAQTELICEETEQKQSIETGVTVEEPDIINVEELMRDLEDEEDMDFDVEINSKKKKKKKKIRGTQSHKD